MLVVFEEFRIMGKGKRTTKAPEATVPVETPVVDVEMEQVKHSVNIFSCFWFLLMS